MDAKDAVKQAKAYVGDLFREDGIEDVRLEEIERDEKEGVWNVTLGFLRRSYVDVSDSASRASSLMAALDAINARTRIYRIVRIREEDGCVISVKHRDLSLDAA